MRSSLLLVAALVVAGAATAQVPKPGQSLVTGTASGGGLWLVDYGARTVVQQTLAPNITGPNCIFMLTNKLGFIGTVGDPADIFEITHQSGTTWKTRKLNTTASAGGNCSQIVMVGGILYWPTQTGGALGTLHSMNFLGGPVTKVLDLATVGATGLANACAAIGTDIYVANWNSGTTATTAEIIKYDTKAKKGSLLMPLPKGKRQTNATTFANTGIVHMRALGNLLALAGVYGDALVVDPASKKVVYHSCTCPRTSATANGSNSINSFDYDPVSGDWLIGSRDAHAERWVLIGDLKDDVSSAERVMQYAATGSMNGIHHFADTATGTDKSTGHGCPGNGGWTLTAANLGSPTAGNANFGFAAWSGTGGDTAVLLLGLAAANVPLGPLGITPQFPGKQPNCFARFNPGTLILSLPLTLQGTGVGRGWVMVKAGLPSTAGGTTLHTQWVELQKTKTNRVGVVVSNGRATKIK